jgi:hypothetical protein
MLPFLKRNHEASSDASASEPIKRKPDEDKEHDGLETAMEELAGHLAAKNFKAAAECFRAAMQLCDAEPHEEGPHTNEE